MYNLLTSVVTVGIAVFLAIYNTGFIQVVTLGGTVLGAFLIALVCGLAAWGVQKIGSRPVRLALKVVACSLALAGVLHYLPGYRLAAGFGGPSLVLVLCIGTALLNEYIFERGI